MGILNAVNTMMGHNVFIIDSLEGAQHTGELVDKITFYTT